MDINPAAAPATPKSRTSKVRGTGSKPDTRAKPAKAAIVKPEPAAATPKKAAAPRKRSAKTQAATTPAVAVRPPAAELSGMIARAAYYIAAQRNFMPGNELDDWLTAERDILARYA